MCTPKAKQYFCWICSKSRQGRWVQVDKDPRGFNLKYRYEFNNNWGVIGSFAQTRRGSRNPLADSNLLMVILSTTQWLQGLFSALTSMLACMDYWGQVMERLTFPQYLVDQRVEVKHLWHTVPDYNLTHIQILSLMLHMSTPNSMMWKWVLGCLARVTGSNVLLTMKTHHNGGFRLLTKSWPYSRGFKLIG